MLLKRLQIWGAALATAALAGTSRAAQSTFVTESGSLAFGLSIPDDNSTNDLYFSLAMPLGIQWAAVGLGSTTMDGALVLMIYPDAQAKGVTFSPRLSTGHSEPEPYAALDYEALSGTGLVDNGSTLVYNAVCHNCRAWPGGGSVDVASPAQGCMFATGPGGYRPWGGDGAGESVKMHYEFGAFALDMVRATGAAGPAAVDPSTSKNSSGAAVVGGVTLGYDDKIAVAHCVILLGSFLGLMPLGVLVLRVGEWVRWHGVNQGIFLVGVTIGSILGIMSSKRYIRSKGFSSAHQIIGLLVFAFVLIQFVLGFMHHRTFKKTQQTTKLAPVHVWLGRLIIILGVANSFLGFPLALSPGYTWILAGLVLAITPLVVLILLIKWWWVKRRDSQGAKVDESPPVYPGQAGYDEPWLHAPQAGGGSYEMGPMRRE